MTPGMYLCILALLPSLGHDSEGKTRFFDRGGQVDAGGAWITTRLMSTVFVSLLRIKTRDKRTQRILSHDTVAPSSAVPDPHPV